MSGLLESLNIQTSKVTRTLDNLVLFLYGPNGAGKTPVATKFPNVLYFAVGHSGLTGLPNVNFIPIRSWSSFKKNIKIITDPKNYEELHKSIETIVIDETETLFNDYCTNYVCSTEGVNKIKEGNSGYGLWKELETEWRDTINKLLSSGFAVIFILHAVQDETGKMHPAGDEKRMLPVILNASDVIGYLDPAGLDGDGKPVYSSLLLADSDKAFARTRNPYFSQKYPRIEEVTAQKIIDAYFDSIEFQAKMDGSEIISREEENKQYENPEDEVPFDELLNNTKKLCSQVQTKLGSGDKVIEVIEATLGAGKKLGNCTEKQREAVQNIYNELTDLLNS